MALVSRTSVSLRLSGDDLDPEQVSEALRCQPSRSAVKGGSWPTPNGGSRIAATGRWNRQVERRVPGDLDGQIAELLAGMTPDLAVWRHITDAYRADVFCGLFVEEGNQGISLGPDVLLSLGQRNLLLDLDIYASDTEPLS